VFFVVLTAGLFHSTSLAIVVVAMVAFRHLLIALAMASNAKAWSHQSLMRQSKMMAMTRRDPIKMPTQTPMVPYKVRFQVQ
jgi:hypothetical protein